MAFGINAKHSNEDEVAFYYRWIMDHGDRIEFCGGGDLDFLFSSDPEAISNHFHKHGMRFRTTGKAYALGSGNSIPEFLPIENDIAMLEGAIRIRQQKNVQPLL